MTYRWNPDEGLWPETTRPWLRTTPNPDDGGFRESIDLTDIVSDYELFGGRSDRHAVGPQPPSDYKVEPLNEPVPWGPSNARWASSSTEVALYRPLIWDVNGYYAALGVDPRANRRELMRAYNALDGQSDVRLTYILSQLLDSDVRRRYDATPVGEPFLDRYVQEDLNRQAARTAGRRSTKGDPVSPNDVLDEWGYVVIPDSSESSADRVETLQGSLVESPSQPDPFPASWGYGYYLWGTWMPQFSRLRVWQELLVTELSEQGCSVRFAVGIKATTEKGYELCREGDDFIFFLDAETKPTAITAKSAVSAYLERTRSNAIESDRTQRNESSMGSPFRTGGDEAEKAGAQNFGNIRFFSLPKVGDSAIIRMLTEQTDWPYASQHKFMKTKPRPADYKGDAKWPESMSAICQNDPNLRELPGYGDCYLCKAPQYQGKDKYDKKLNATTIRVWALCCLREEVRDDSGKVVGYQDKLIEITDAQGTKKLVRDIRVINMSSKNFFSHLTGAYHVFGTVLDRDFVVTRRGDGIETEYPCVPLAPIEDHKPGTKSWQVYEEALKEQDIDLTEIMMERCSPDYFARFFIPGDGESKAPEAEKGADEPQAPADPERISALRDRIQSYRADSNDTETASS